MLQMLEGDDPTTKYKRRIALSRAERQVSHLVRLVDDLLEITRINHGKIGLKKERIEIASVLSDAIEISQSLIEDGPHQLTIEFLSESLRVDADRVRLAQVFANLLNNAAKYSEPGGRIDVSARRNGDDVIVTVSDKGIGISPDQLSSIFEIFAQVESGANKSVSGVGIGLALARGLIQLHGGSIEARSEGLGHGSEFIVRLPFAGADRSALSRNLKAV